MSAPTPNPSAPSLDPRHSRPGTDADAQGPEDAGRAADGPPQRTHPSAPVRWLLLVAGVLSTLLGTLGAFLPVLPTTPFLILAGACFARSSPRFQGWLERSPVFGPYLVQWNRDHSVPRAAKRKAYGLVVVTFTVSIVLVDAWWLRGVLVGVGTGLLLFLVHLPTTGERVEAPEDPA